MHDSGPQILVVRRIDYDADPRFAPTAQRMTAANLTPSEVTRRYRGIDGDPWPMAPGREPIALSAGLASSGDLPAILAYHASLKGSGLRADLIALGPRGRSGQDVASQLPGWESIGWDIGYYESEYNLYSFLFHEVIFARFSSLSRMSVALNDSLLAPSMRVAKQILAEKEALESMGEVFESEDSGEIIEPIAIWCLAAGR